jgi:hypothetical protein
MARRWVEEIRQRGQLSVFANLSDVWNDAYRRAFTLFNLFAIARDVGVLLTPATLPPDPNNPAAANVQISTYQSNSFNEGRTSFSKRTGDPPDQMAAAFIEVPATPIARIEGQAPRPIGEEPKVLMIAHELIHAWGLSDSDHTPADNPDVFSTGWIPDIAKRPEDDGLHLGQTKAPPFVFSVRTAQLIRKNWTAP